MVGKLANQSPTLFTQLIAICENKEILQRLNEWLTIEISLNLKSMGSQLFSKLEHLTWQVSLPQVFCGNFVETALNLADVVNDYGMTLIIAVAESDTEQLADSPLALSEAFQSADIRIAVDAKGTGSSLLGRLPNLPIQQIRFNCREANANPRSRQNAEINEYLNQTLIELSRLMGLDCVARHITQKAEVIQFRGANCEYGQGLYLSKPLPLRKLQDILLQSIPFGASHSAGKR
jgi:EAL domain-containing protein (putative c-di-GMP-specific phosphodiesterase class I)